MNKSTQVVLLESTDRGLEVRAVSATSDYPREVSWQQLQYEIKIGKEWDATIVDLKTQQVVASFSAASCRSDLKVRMTLSAIDTVRLIKVLQTYHSDLFETQAEWYFILLTPLGCHA